MFNRFFVCLTVSAIVLALSGQAIAGDQGFAQGNKNAPTRKSAGGMDNDLPPVFPGEEVEDSQGNNMVVWSSGGAIAGSEVPEPPSAPELNNNNQINPANVGVLVEQDDFERRRRR